MKDHEIRELVNQLRDVAIKYHGAGQLREQIARTVRAAMLQAGNSPVIPDGYVMVPKEPTSEMVKKMRYHVGGYDRNIKEGYKAMLAAAPTGIPMIPEGYVMVPMRLTAENGAKGVLSGEFSETQFVNCPECFGDDECETCDGSGIIEIKVPVSWTTIKEIWIKGVEYFAAAPQENN